MPCSCRCRSLHLWAQPPWSGRGLGGFILAQLLFTGTPPLLPLFDCRPVDMAAGLLSIGLGLLLLEMEKLLVRLMNLDVQG